MKTPLRIALLLVVCLGCGVAAAQNVRYAGADPTSFGSVRVGDSNIQTRSIGVQGVSDISEITALNVTGSGFTLVGGTCTPGFVVNSVNTCTVQLAFAPAATGTANGSLFINCSTAIPSGGVTILCDAAGGSIGLIGDALTALNVPTLSPAALTSLSLLLLAAMLVTLRRRHRQKI
jgi:hypothetical protein